MWIAPGLAAISLVMLVMVLAEAADGLMQRAQNHRQARLDRLGRQLEAIFLFVSPERLLLLNTLLIAFGAIASWAFTTNVVWVAVTVILLWLGPRFVYGAVRKRRLRRIEAQLPDAIMSLAGALRAGASLNTGLVQLAQELQAPLAQEIELIVREQRLGVAQDTALDNFARRIPLPMVVLLVSTIRIAAETGGELADALVRTAHTLRAVAQAEGKIAALTAQGRMQAWVVGLLPVLLLLVLNRMEPEAMGKLWTTPIGWGALAAMVFLEGMGMWLIRRIVAIDV